MALLAVGEKQQKVNHVTIKKVDLWWSMMFSQEFSEATFTDW
ncbi:hypothetical protein [Okeania sp. SIO2F4]|nr:hypothetical protein [Okeania sp. SIO2F4]